MRIIIPMAGRGSRFTKIGFQCFKHEILANGKTLFEWSMLSLSDFFEHPFVFIVRQGMDVEAIRHHCNDLGIKNIDIVTLSNVTDGQASTVMQADGLIQEEEGLVIYNIDTYVEEGLLRTDAIHPDAAGFVPAFVAEGDKWSFVEVAPEDPNRVVRITEKIRISDLGTLGLYYFKHWRTFKELYQTHKPAIVATYKETYIAPMYQYLIDQGERVETSIIPTDRIHVLGTPQDLAVFHPDYLAENNL